jgi:hypothetical protein
MAINVYLQTLDGKKKSEAFDLNYSMAKDWPINDPSFPLLQYLDPYGNAIFNGAQMGEIRKELMVLIERSSSGEQKTFLRSIHQLADQCEQHPHTFLRFRGD